MSVELSRFCPGTRRLRR